MLSGAGLKERHMRFKWQIERRQQRVSQEDSKKPRAIRGTSGRGGPGGRKVS